MQLVTREHKLALIVGFSLILLVGVLISDHLSRARQAQVGPVTTHEAQVGDTTFPAPIDPILAIENAPRPSVPSLIRDGTQVASGHPEPTSGGGVAQPFTPAGPETGALIYPPSPASGQRQAAAGGPREIPTEITTIKPQDTDAAFIEHVRATGGKASFINNEWVITPAALVQSDTSKPKPPRAEAASAAPLKTYTIQKGDNLTRLAAKEYGDGKLWTKLAKFNGIGDEDGTVQLGRTIKLPPKDVLLGKAAQPQLVNPAPNATPARQHEPGPVKPGRTELVNRGVPAPAAKDLPKNKTLGTHEPVITYIVKKGETLGDIAKRTLGSSRRWPELAEFNKLDDEDHLPAGTVLKVPPMRG
jgi:LysM repeat protein